MEFFTPSFSTEYFSPIHLHESTISSLNITAFRFFSFFFQKKKKNVENAHVAFFFYIREKLTGKYIVHGDDRSSICQPGEGTKYFWNIVIHDKEKPSFLLSILKESYGIDISK